MFEKSSRLKVRFDYKGLCADEDLWDAPFEDLDSLFKKMNLELSEQKGESLLKAKAPEIEILELKIAIVKHVVVTRLAERDARENEADRTARKQKILSIIADKQDEELHGQTVEDLTKLVDEL